LHQPELLRGDGRHAAPARALAVPVPRHAAAAPRPAAAAHHAALRRGAEARPARAPVDVPGARRRDHRREVHRLPRGGHPDARGDGRLPLLLVRFYPVAAGPLVAGYLGLWMLAAAFVACGLFVSALTENQLLAGAATYGVLLFFWVVTWNEAAMNEVTRHLLLPFSLFDRFYTFALGAVDTGNVSYLVLFTAAFLCFTFFALDARRW